MLADAGALGPSTTAVHATHLTTADIALLHDSTACFCPSTEADLADGIGPARELADAGTTLSLGSDQHAASTCSPKRATSNCTSGCAPAGGACSHRPNCWLRSPRTEASAGPTPAGSSRRARADLVAVRLDTVRTAGCDPAQIVFAAGAADIDTVLVDGRAIVARRRSTSWATSARCSDQAIEAAWQS